MPDTPAQASWTLLTVREKVGRGCMWKAGIMAGEWPNGSGNTASRARAQPAGYPGFPRWGRSANALVWGVYIPRCTILQRSLRSGDILLFRLPIYVGGAPAAMCDRCLNLSGCINTFSGSTCCRLCGRSKTSSADRERSDLLDQRESDVGHAARIGTPDEIFCLLPEELPAIAWWKTPTQAKIPLVRKASSRGLLNGG